MILQSTFECLKSVIEHPQHMCGYVQTNTNVDLFLNPRWLVIHKETKRGFYVDRCHEPTISVSKCVAPDFFVEKFDRCIFDRRPTWALSELALAFVTYVLETT